MIGIDGGGSKTEFLLFPSRLGNRNRQLACVLSDVCMQSMYACSMFSFAQSNNIQLVNISNSCAALLLLEHVRMYVWKDWKTANDPFLAERLKITKFLPQLFWFIYKRNLDIPIWIVNYVAFSNYALNFTLSTGQPHTVKTNTTAQNNIPH